MASSVLAGASCFAPELVGASSAALVGGASLCLELEPAPPARGDLLTDLLTDLRGQQPRIRRAAMKHGIRNVRVFGSAARGEETARSDVDLLVDFDIEGRRVLPLVAFAREVSRIVGRPVDASTPEMLAPKVRRAALLDAVPL